MICVKCGEEFILRPNKPGRINECEICARDVPIYLAQQGGEDGIVEHLTLDPNKVRTRLKAI